jgi:hypothetical protein
MKSFIQYIINFFKLDHEKCSDIIINKTSSSKKLGEVKNFLVNEETKFLNGLSDTRALLRRAEIEYTDRLALERKYRIAVE